MRVGLLLAVLIALIYVGFTAGGDPCNRCTLELELETIDCRSAFEYYAEQKYDIGKRVPIEYTSPLDLNISFG